MYLFGTWPSDKAIVLIMIINTGEANPVHPILKYLYAIQVYSLMVLMSWPQSFWSHIYIYSCITNANFYRPGNSTSFTSRGFLFSQSLSVTLSTAVFNGT